MATADKLSGTEVPAKEIATGVLLYAGAFLLDFLGSLIGNIAQLPKERYGIESVLTDLSTIVLFAALVFTVYIAGNYLLNAR